MKRIVLVLLILLITGCSLNLESNPKEEDKIVEEKDEEKEEDKKEIEYQDENPLKVSFYQENNSTYKKIDLFKSKLESYKDIGVFSMIMDDKDEIKGNFKDIYNNIKNNYDDFSKYKIGYNISFVTIDGKEFNETILKPIDLFEYSFSGYLYIWLYDDINTSGWHSHLEAKDYNDNTVMSSIKLMSTDLSRKVVDGFKVTVFTYDTLDDFDSNGNYRGNSKSTLKVEYKED